MADIFISYKREDRAVAEQLAGALGQLGFDVWWDFALLSGDQYRKVIREVINQCKAAIVLWSARAVDSEFVMDEAAHAKAQGKLCPTRIDGVELPFGFGQTHTDDLRNWSGEMSHSGFSSLLRALEGKTGKKARLGARPRDASAERQFAELEAFKAAQIAGTQDALNAFLRRHPAGAFSDFVRSQLGGAAPPPPPPRYEPSFASTASASRPAPEPKRSPWPVIAVIALLIGAGGVGWTMWQGAQTRTAEADPSSSTAQPSTSTRNVDAEIEAVRAEERVKADDAAFAQAQTVDSVAAYDGYLSAYPSGRHASEAGAARVTADLRERNATARANADAAERADEARRQTERQLAQREQTAKDQADDAAYAVARSANTAAAYDAYLRNYPYGRNASSARSARSSLSTSTASAVPGAYDLSQLNSNVRSSVELARSARSQAESAAARARAGAPQGEEAARRARAGEAGYDAYSTSSGYRYEGGYSSKQNGWGVSTWADGDRLVSQYVDGKSSGVGVYSYAADDTSNALRYEGERGNDYKSGYGILLWRDGLRYAGNFVNDKRGGSGIFDFADGRRYEGEWANDKYNGYGVLWDANGKVISSGTWTDNSLTTSLSR